MSNKENFLEMLSAAIPDDAWDFDFRIEYLTTASVPLNHEALSILTRSAVDMAQGTQKRRRVRIERGE